MSVLDTSVLPMAAPAGQPSRCVKQVVDRDGQVVIRVHEARGRRHDAVAIGVGVVAERDREAIAQRQQAGHRVRAGAVHPDLAVVIERA